MLPASSVSGDKYRYCPYDITHVILAKRFDAHLIKCKENHRGHNRVVCRLDHTHVVPKPELNHHLSQCDKRSLMDRELQKRAGIEVLKGDVEGPPIVADHLAGKDAEEMENWDDAPVRSLPTPALFNEKIKNSCKDSYGIVPGGGYAPPSTGEPKIRKIPNNPAKAATLSNLASAQIRPTGNRVFEYSIGNMRMLRPDGNLARPLSTSLHAGAPGAPRGMTRVRAPAPDQGPRFIGRGISKYATKSDQRPSAANGSAGSPLSSTVKSDHQNSQSGITHQFEDITTQDYNTDNVPGKSERDGGDSITQLTQPGNFDNNAFTPPGLKTLEDSILLHQQQLEQLKQQHNQQQLVLAKKHQLQTFQLQKLQEEEKKNLVQEQGRQELELCAKAQALSRSIQEMSALASSSSSSSSSQMDRAIQNVVAPSILEAVMSTGGHSLPGHLSSMTAMNIQGPSNLVVSLEPSEVRIGTEAIGETWHEGNAKTKTADVEESLSRLTVQDSRENNETGSATSTKSSSLADAERIKTTLQNRLREIEILEQKSLLGHVLSTLEEDKLESKEVTKQQLSSLQSNQSEKA